MSELIGLPRPPAVGASALPAGTFDDATVFVTGAGTGLGKAIAAEFARLGAAIASRPASRCSGLRLAITTTAPRRANSAAIALPSPVPAPVTNTTSPS